MKYSIKEKDENGTISLEAAIMMPIFIIVIMLIYGIMLMFSGQQLINHALIQSSESLSIDSYAGEIKYDSNSGNRDLAYDVYKSFVISNGNLLDSLGSTLNGNDISNFSTNKKWYNPETASEKKDMIPIVQRRFIGYLTNEKDINQGKEQAKNILEKYGIKDGIDFSVEIKDKTLIIKAKFKQDFIFDFHGLASFDREIVTNVRMWQA